jgi:hypothetical protein
VRIFTPSEGGVKFELLTQNHGMKEINADGTVANDTTNDADQKLLQSAAADFKAAQKDGVAYDDAPCSTGDWVMGAGTCAGMAVPVIDLMSAAACPLTLGDCYRREPPSGDPPPDHCNTPQPPESIPMCDPAAAQETQLNPPPVPAASPVDPGANGTTGAPTNNCPDGTHLCGGSQDLCCPDVDNPPGPQANSGTGDDTSSDEQQQATQGDDSSGQQTAENIPDQPDYGDEQLQTAQDNTGDDGTNPPETTQSALSSPTASCNSKRVLQCGTRGGRAFCRCTTVTPTRR